MKPVLGLCVSMVELDKSEEQVGTEKWVAAAAAAAAAADWRLRGS